MRIKSVLLPALLAGLALPIGLPPTSAQRPVAVPVDPGRGGPPQVPAGPTLKPVLLGGGSDERFLRLDRNGDGALNFDEMPEDLRAERDKWDANGDGHIDLAEWKAYRAAVAGHPPMVVGPVVRLPAPEPQPPTLAPDRPPPGPGMGSRPPGKVSFPGSTSRPPFNENARRKGPDGAARQYPKNMPAWFKEYDADGDGQIGLYEWKAKNDDPREFDKYDLNHDGYITLAELVRSGQFATPGPVPQVVSQLQAEVGDYFYLEVKGSTRGTVWGTDVYTADSLLAAAAVHAGVLAVGESGLIKVTVLAGQDRYEGSTQNGVTSHDFAQFPRSFRVEAIK